MLLDLIRRSTGEEITIETDDHTDLSIFMYADGQRGLKRLADGSIVKCELGAYKDIAEEKQQESEDIVKARGDYLDVFGKEVPNNKKNDVEWINAKVKTTLVEDEIIPEVTEEVIVPEVVKEMIENPIVETVVEEAPEAPEVIVPEEIKKPEIIDGDTEVLFGGEAIKGDILAKELEDGRKLLATIIDDPELQEDGRYKFTVVYKYL